MTREQYLSKPLLPNVQYTLNENLIRIESDCTLFLDIRLPDKIPLQSIENKWKQLNIEVRGNEKVRIIGSAAFLKRLRDNYPAYSDSVDTLRVLFKELYMVAEQIKADGIHMGCSDDELLLKVSQIEASIKKLRYRDTPYTIVVDLDNYVSSILSDKMWELKTVESVQIHLV